MKVFYDKLGRRLLKFKKYLVQQNQENFFGVYRLDDEKLLIHKSTWRQATKIASLLE